MPSGTKRTASVGRSSRACASLTLPTSCHASVLAKRYCQVPLPTSSAVMAMPPMIGLVLPSVMVPPVAVTADTNCPILLLSFSVIVVSVGVPLASTGAWLSVCGVSVMVLAKLTEVTLGLLYSTR